MAKLKQYINDDEPYDSSLFLENYSELLNLVEKEKKKIVGGSKSEAARIERIYIDINHKASFKHQKLGGNFLDLLGKERDIRFSRGMLWQEFALSELMLITHLCHALFKAGEINAAFKQLITANRCLGNYLALDYFVPDFNEPTNKQPPKTFKKETLLKLIYGMAAHDYNCTQDNIDITANHIIKALQKHNILVNEEEVLGYLYDSYELKADWLKNTIGGLNATEIEKNSMLKLIIGMAIDKYNHNINSNKNKSTSTKYGILVKIANYAVVNVGTVRDCLKVAKKLIEPDIKSS